MLIDKYNDEYFFLATEEQVSIKFKKAVLHRWNSSFGKKKLCQEIRLDDDKSRIIKVSDNYTIIGLFIEKKVPFEIVYFD